MPSEKWAGADMFKVACEVAAAHFAEAGAERPVRFMDENVLAQEHHFVGKVVFWFWLKIKGQDRYYHYTCTLDPRMITELVNTGMWPATALPGLPN